MAVKENDFDINTIKIGDPTIEGKQRVFNVNEYLSAKGIENKGLMPDGKYRVKKGDKEGVFDPVEYLKSKMPVMKDPVSDKRSFYNTVAQTLKFEGPESNDPEDEGGLTRFGIAQNFNPDIDVSKLTEPEAVKIYKTKYWDSLNLDNIKDEHTARHIFDTSVNPGPGATKKLVQNAMEIAGVDDLNKATPEQLDEFNDVLADERSNYYQNRIIENPAKEKYAEGWQNRVDFWRQRQPVEAAKVQVRPKVSTWLKGVQEHFKKENENRRIEVLQTKGAGSIARSKYEQQVKDWQSRKPDVRNARTAQELMDVENQVREWSASRPVSPDRQAYRAGIVRGGGAIEDRNLLTKTSDVLNTIKNDLGFKKLSQGVRAAEKIVTYGFGNKEESTDGIYDFQDQLDYFAGLDLVNSERDGYKDALKKKQNKTPDEQDWLKQNDPGIWASLALIGNSFVENPTDAVINMTGDMVENFPAYLAMSFLGGNASMLPRLANASKTAKVMTGLGAEAVLDLAYATADQGKIDGETIFQSVTGEIAGEIMHGGFKGLKKIKLMKTMAENSPIVKKLNEKFQTKMREKGKDPEIIPELVPSNATKPITELAIPSEKKKLLEEFQSKNAVDHEQKLVEYNKAAEESFDEVANDIVKEQAAKLEPSVKEAAKSVDQEIKINKKINDPNFVPTREYFEQLTESTGQEFTEEEIKKLTGFDGPLEEYTARRQGLKNDLDAKAKAMADEFTMSAPKDIEAPKKKAQIEQTDLFGARTDAEKFASEQAIKSQKIKENAVANPLKEMEEAAAKDAQIRNNVEMDLEQSKPKSQATISGKKQDIEFESEKEKLAFEAYTKDTPEAAEKAMDAGLSRQEIDQVAKQSIKQARQRNISAKNKPTPVTKNKDLLNQFFKDNGMKQGGDLASRVNELSSKDRGRLDDFISEKLNDIENVSGARDTDSFIERMVSKPDEPAFAKDVSTSKEKYDKQTTDVVHQNLEEGLYGDFLGKKKVSEIMGDLKTKQVSVGGDLAVIKKTDSGYKVEFQDKKIKPYEITDSNKEIHIDRYGKMELKKMSKEFDDKLVELKDYVNNVLGAEKQNIETEQFINYDADLKTLQTLDKSLDDVMERIKNTIGDYDLIAIERDKINDLLTKISEGKATKADMAVLGLAGGTTALAGIYQGLFSEEKDETKKADINAFLALALVLTGLRVGKKGSITKLTNPVKEAFKSNYGFVKKTDAILADASASPFVGADFVNKANVSDLFHDIAYAKSKFNVLKKAEKLTQEQLEQIPQIITGDIRSINLDPKLKEVVNAIREEMVNIDAEAKKVGFKWRQDPEKYWPRYLDFDAIQKMKKELEEFVSSGKKLEDFPELKKNIDHVAQQTYLDAETGLMTKFTVPETIALLANYFDGTAEMRAEKAMANRRDFINKILEGLGENVDPLTLNKIINSIDSKFKNSIMGNLKYGRKSPELHPDMYRKDILNIANNYFDNAHRAIEQRRALGNTEDLSLDKVENYLKTVPEGERPRIEEFVRAKLSGAGLGSMRKNASKEYEAKAKAISSVLLKANNVRYILASLGTSAVKNILFFANGASTQGIYNTIKNAAKAVKFKNRREAEMFGAYSTKLADMNLSITADELKLVKSDLPDTKFWRFIQGVDKDFFEKKWIKKPLKTMGFEVSEQFVRTTAYFMGKDAADKFFMKAQKGNKIARNNLVRILGEKNTSEILAQGVLPDDMKTAFAVGYSQYIAGRTKLGDVPPWTKTIEGRLLAQFKTMSYNITDMMTREVFGQNGIKGGNFAPLVRVLATMGITGSIAMKMQQAFRSEEDRQKRADEFEEASDLEKALIIAVHSQVLGLYGDTYNSLDTRGNEGITPLIGAMSGPTVDLGIRGARALIYDFSPLKENKEGEGPLPYTRRLAKNQVTLLRQIDNLAGETWFFNPEKGNE